MNDIDSEYIEADSTEASPAGKDESDKESLTASLKQAEQSDEIVNADYINLTESTTHEELSQYRLKRPRKVVIKASIKND